MGTLAVVLVGGLFLDLWAHSHGRVDETFFTPWHAILYAGAGLHGGVLLAFALRGRRQGLPLRRSLPPGYGLSLIGAVLFLIAGIIDLGWHEVFGFEDGTEALLSPSHLLLATSGVFMVSGPLRSAWAGGVPSRFPGWLPWGLALTMLLSIITSFTEYAHPAIDTWPAATPTSFADRSSLLLVDGDGRSQTRMPLDLGENVWLPDYFPDGERVVVSVATGETGSLYMMGLDGSDPRLLFEGEGIFHHPQVSPDGTKVAFTASGVESNAEIFVVEVEGGEVDQVTDDLATDWGPTWAPDSASITFVSDRDGDGDLYSVPASGGRVVQLVNLDGNQASPDWSPDGTRLAFDADTDGDVDVYVMNADGSSVAVLTVNDVFDSNPIWSPDGSSIAFVTDRDGDSELYVMDATGNQPVNLTRNPAAHDGWGGIAWSPDGSVIATNTSGWVNPFYEPFFRESLGVATLLIQAALIAGFLLLILSRGPLPFGAVTLMLAVNAALMSVISDNYWYIVPAAIAGIVGDLLARGISNSEPSRRARILASAVPAVWYASYLGAVAIIEGGLGWSIHMVLGAPVIAGIVGLLLSLLVFPGSRPPQSDLVEVG